MTSNQKFLSLLKHDSFFKKECSYLRKKWGIKNNKDFFKCPEVDLPIDYKKDLNFVLEQSKLSERFFSPLHKYIITGKIPLGNTLPSPIRISWRWKERTIGKIIIEGDVDMTQKDITSEMKNINFLKEQIKKIYDIDIKMQPIRNFDETSKITKDRKSIELADLEELNGMDIEDIRKINLKTKNRLEVKRSRHKKNISDIERVCVKKREDFEKHLASLSPDF